MNIDPVRRLSRTEAGRDGLGVDGKSRAVQTPHGWLMRLQDPAHTQTIPPLTLETKTQGKSPRIRPSDVQVRSFFPRKKQTEEEKENSCGKK